MTRLPKKLNKIIIRKSPTQTKSSSSAIPPPSPLGEDNIAQIEKQTIERANKALSALEVAIASWDASKEKPKTLEAKFTKYRKLHQLLSEWERKMLESLGKREDLNRRAERLQEFIEICHIYR